MSRKLVFCLLTLSLSAWADDVTKPEKIPLSTWVREDLFAGWLAKDMTTYERGARKVDAYLQDHSADHTALAWKYFVLGVRMRTAREAQDADEYQRLKASADGYATRALNSVPAGNPAPYIIVGGTKILLAYYLPDEDRRQAYQDGRELLRRVPQIQAKYFETLPPHMRGELWSQMALASDRLGDKEDRDRSLNDLVIKLKGSPYENRARRWQAQTEIKSQADHLCISCHDPGRLEATVTRLQTAK